MFCNRRTTTEKVAAICAEGFSDLSDCYMTDALDGVCSCQIRSKAGILSAKNSVPTALLRDDRDMEFGLMFRSLGQVIHLVQDVAQPQHVRNDPHTDVPIIGNPSVYEKYVEATYAKQPTPGTPYSPPSFPKPNDFFANASQQGIAQFTNSNFVSFGTNCTTNQIYSCAPGGGYGYPSPVIETGPIAVKVVQDVYKGDTKACESDLEALLTEFPTLCSTAVVSYFVGNNVHDSIYNADTQNDRMSTYSIVALDRLLANQFPDH